MKKTLLNIFTIFLFFGLFLTFAKSTIHAQAGANQYRCGWISGACTMDFETCSIGQYKADYKFCESFLTETECLVNQGPHDCKPETTPPVENPPKSDPGTFTCQLKTLDIDQSQICGLSTTRNCNTGFVPDDSVCADIDAADCTTKSGPYDCIPKAVDTTPTYPSDSGKPYTQNPVTSMDVDCGDTIKDLQANPDPLAYNRNNIGRPIYCNGSLLSNRIKFKRASVSGTFSWLGDIINALTQDKSWTASVAETKVFDFGPDKTSSEKPDEAVNGKKDWRTFFAGYNPTKTEKNIAYINEKNLAGNQTDVLGLASDNNDIYENSSVIEKMQPYLSMNANKEWKPTEIADREKLLCGTLSGYKKSIYGTEGKQEPLHDYTAGFITSSGIKSAPSGTSRPLYGIEILCTNSKLVCPGISKSLKNDICQQIMGGNFGSGVISAESVLGKVFKSDQLAIRTPSKKCIYEKSKGCGGLYYLPIVSIEEHYGELCEVIDVKKGDIIIPSGFTYTGNRNTFERCQKIAVPAGAALGASEKVFNLLSNLQDQEKEKTYEYGSELMPEQYAQTGTYDSNWVGSPFKELTDRIALQTSVLGLHSDNGQVLAETAVPADSGAPSSQTQHTQTENRDVNYTLRVNEKDMAAVYNLNNIGFKFLPFQDVETLTKPLPGTENSAAIAPVKNAIKFTGAISGTSETQFPFVGGPLVVIDPDTGVGRRMATRPYDPKWYPQEKTGEYVRSLAMLQELETLAKNPWTDLLSYQKFQSDQANKTKTDLSQK